MKKNLILLLAIGSFFLLSSVGIVENNKYVKNKSEQLHKSTLNNCTSEILIDVQNNACVENSIETINDSIEKKKHTISEILGTAIVGFFQSIFNVLIEIIKN